jgi:hypothetical protein
MGLGVALALLLIPLMLAIAWAICTIPWSHQRSLHDRFFALPLAERRRLRRAIEGKAVWINRILRPLACWA